MIDEPQHDPTGTEPKLGRNAPCPCGSGRKYKKCCGRDSAELKLAPAPADRETAIGKLARFTQRPEFLESVDEARELFFGDALSNAPPEDMAWVLSSENVLINFAYMHMIDFALDDGRTILDHFLERQAARLSPFERQFLEGLRDTYVGLYEVQEVVRDQGLRLKDLWDGQEIWVSEQLGTHQLVAWDVIAARLMQHPGPRWEIEADQYLLPADSKQRAVRWLKQEHRRFRNHTPEGDKVAYFKYLGGIFNQMWLAEVVLRPAPTVLTTEGDPLEPGKSVYDVQDRTAVAEALDAHPQLDRDETDQWGWIEEAPEFTRRLGTVSLEGRCLILEAMSRPRLKRLRALVSAACGGAVRHRHTRYEQFDLSRRPDATNPEPEPPARPDPEIETYKTEWLDQHYHRWVEEPVPALGHRTPRHAATLKTVRPKLVDLLKQMENQETRAAQRGGPTYDFGWIWRELGLQHPS